MCPYHFSLRLFTAVRSSYSPMAFPILAFTSSLIMWSLYEIPRSLRKRLISNACILLSMSAVMVRASHAHKNMDMAREPISLILELMAMFLSFQMTFSLVTAALVWDILDSTSGLECHCGKEHYAVEALLRSTAMVHYECCLKSSQLCHEETTLKQNT